MAGKFPNGHPWKGRSNAIGAGRRRCATTGCKRFATHGYAHCYVCGGGEHTTATVLRNTGRKPPDGGGLGR